MGLTSSQYIESGKVGDAYDELYAQNETLKTEKAALTQALEGMLKERDSVPDAVVAAKQVLETLEDNPCPPHCGCMCCRLGE